MVRGRLKWPQASPGAESVARVGARTPASSFGCRDCPAAPRVDPLGTVGGCVGSGQAPHGAPCSRVSLVAGRRWRGRCTACSPGSLRRTGPCGPSLRFPARQLSSTRGRAAPGPCPSLVPPQSAWTGPGAIRPHGRGARPEPPPACHRGKPPHVAYWFRRAERALCALSTLRRGRRPTARLKPPAFMAARTRADDSPLQREGPELEG